MKKQMLKNVGKRIAALSTVTALAVGLAACGGGSGKSDGSAAPEKAAKSSGDSYEIIVNLTQSAEAASTKLMKEECEKIEEATDGRLKFTVYDSGTLVGINDVFKGVQDGICDITFMPNSMGYDYTVLNSRLLTLPMMGYTSTDNGNAVYDKLRSEFPEIDAEMEEFGLVNLGVYFNGGTDIYMEKDVKIESIDDLKGMKIGNSDSQQNDLINGIGATGVFVSSADAYTSIDNGVVDAMVQHPLFFKVTGCADIINHVVQISNTGLMRGNSMMVMNKTKYDSLPEDLQQALKDGFDEIINKNRELEKNDIESYLQTLKDNGTEFTTLSDEQIAPLKEDALELHKATIQELEEKGVNAQAIYDRAQELIKSEQ